MIIPDLSSVPHSRQNRTISRRRWRYVPPVLPDIPEEQNMLVVRTYAPSRLDVTVDDRPCLPAFAIHPYIVAVRYDTLPKPYYRIAEEDGGDYCILETTQTIIAFTYDLAFFVLSEPIMLKKPVPDAFSIANYQQRQIEYMFERAKEIIKNYLKIQGTVTKEFFPSLEDELEK